MSGAEFALHPNATVVAAREQVSAELEGEAVILNLADGIYYGLDGVGARIWDLLSAPRTAAQLRDAITTEYEVDEATAWADLSDLLADLARRGLVEITPP